MRSAISSRTFAMASLPKARASRGTPRCYGAGLIRMPAAMRRGRGRARDTRTPTRDLRARGAFARTRRRASRDRGGPRWERGGRWPGGRRGRGGRQRHGDSHVALRGEAKLARARRHRERELVRRERFRRSMEPAVHGAEVNERPRAKAGVRNFALLHQVAGRLERLGARGKLAVLDVQDASGVQQLGKLGGIAVRVDKGHRFAQTFERLLSLALRRVGRSEETQQRGALGGRGLLGEGGRGLVTDGPPIAALEGGLGRETMEQPTFRAGQGLVADEVIEASPEPRGDDLEGAEGGTNQPGLHLTNEALG